MYQDYASLFEFCPIGVYRSSPDGRQLRANPALAQLNGYADEAQMLAHVRDIGTEWYVDPDRRAQFTALLERNGQVRDFVSEVRRHKTGERIWVREHAHVVRDAQGTIRFYEGTVEEITHDVLAREALRRSEEEMRRVTDQVPGLIFRLHIAPDGQRRYDFVSSGARAIFGIEPEAIMADGELLRACIHPEDWDDYAAISSVAVKSGAPITHEFRALPPDGRMRWVQLISSAVPSIAPGLARIGVVVDITERKLAETLRRERDHAETAHRMSSQFLSRVSHELRTPLNAVLGFAQLLELGQPSDEQRQRWVQEILASGRHLLGLVDDVLDLSSAQSGQQRLRIEPVDPGEALAQASTMLAPQAQTSGVALPAPPAPDTSHHVLADRQRLRQVLGNLLSNGIKYNRPGGTVRVTLTRRGDVVDIAVADTGIGMSPEQQVRLFHPFDRLGAEQLGIPGTGLGLSLSRQLVDAMGGSIAVDSAPGRGSVFTVTLPAAPAASANAALSGART